MRLVVPLAGFAVAVLFSACEAPEKYHLAGDPIDDAQVRMVVADRDSIDTSSGSPKASRWIHLEWSVTPGAFARYPHLLAVRNDWLRMPVRLDTLRSQVGEVDFLWECQKGWYADTVDCRLALQHMAEVYAVLPQGVLLQVAREVAVR